MVDLTAKIFLFPALLFFSSKWLPGLYFATVQQTLLVGAILAVLAAAIDHWYLNKIKNPLSTVLDWGLTTLLVWGLSGFWLNTQVTLFGAALFAVLIAVVEYLAHDWLLKNHSW